MGNTAYCQCVPIDGQRGQVILNSPDEQLDKSVCQLYTRRLYETKNIFKETSSLQNQIVSRIIQDNFIRSPQVVEVEIQPLINNNLPLNEPDGNIKQLAFQKGGYYQGIIINGIKQGKGKIYLPYQNFQYNGEWKNNVPHGFGIQRLQDFVYTGMFSEGQKNGQGTLQLPDGSIFKGIFKNNIPISGQLKPIDEQQRHVQLNDGQVILLGVGV